MRKPYLWFVKLSSITCCFIMLLSFTSASATASTIVMNANQYKAFHDTYDESDPDQKFLNALAQKFYNVELDVMVDSNKSTYSGSQYPSYLQGKVKLYVKHDAAASPNTRDLYKYFEDVVAQVEQNGGSLHGDGKSIIINLDMKTANSPNYANVASSLQAIFQHYEGLMSFGYVGDRNSYSEEAITICLSGAEALKDAYFQLISNSGGKLLAFKDEVYSTTDSRYSNVNNYFPTEADIYHRFYAIHWKHIESGFDLLMPGNWSQDDQDRLEQMMSLASEQGYTIRFYSLNGNEGAWYYKFPYGDGEAAQRWTQFAYMNHKLGTNHFVSTDSYEAMTKVYDQFFVPMRDYNYRVEKQGGTQNGQDPSVSITDDGRIVEIHKGEGIFNNNLWYSVGMIEGNGYIQWVTNERINPGGNNKNGVQPSSDVTNINGQTIVVQVNQTDGSGSGLWANIGKLETNSTIAWHTNEAIKLGSQQTEGSWAHIAMEGNKIVLVYINGGKLHYQTGTVNATNYKIEWNASGTINNYNGEHPDVDIQDDQIIVVYRNDSQLKYALGTMASNKVISWNGFGNMQGQDGKDPTVTFIDQNKVIEMHTSESTGLIWYNTGNIEGTSIEWIHNYVWDSGSSSKPSIAYHPENNLLVDVHKASSNDALWYNTGRININ